MLSPSDFNNAVPQFTNGTYASNPINPQYVNEPTSTEYNQGVEPLQTLPAQWWNWFINKFTGRFNKINTYVKNIFNELTELLSLGNITPDGTEATPTTCQLKDMFASCYPDYVKCCTTGTACGCIPVIGTDLGNTNNNILVTDANGQLKPSGITVGTAAGCDASCFMPAGEPPLYAQCLVCIVPHDPVPYYYEVGITNCSCLCFPYFQYAANMVFVGYRDGKGCDNRPVRSQCSDVSIFSVSSASLAPAVVGNYSPLCLMCKGRTGCCFCVWICAKEDIFLYQRPNSVCCTCCHACGGILGGCGPYFINKGDWLYWCCPQSSQMYGCFDCWFCIQHTSTTFPGEEEFLKCFYSRNGNVTSNGFQKINKGMWTVVPVRDYMNDYFCWDCRNC